MSSVIWNKHVRDVVSRNFQSYMAIIRQTDDPYDISLYLTNLRHIEHAPGEKNKNLAELLDDLRGKGYESYLLCRSDVKTAIGQAMADIEAHQTVTQQTMRLLMHVRENYSVKLEGISP